MTPRNKQSAEPSKAATSRVQTVKVYLIFIASGAAALTYQIIWARLLTFVFGNTAASISIVLGSFMLGLALGSWLIGRMLHRIANPMRLYAYLELGIGIYAVLFPWLHRITDWIFTSLVGADSPQGFSLAVRAALSFLLLVVPTTLMGATLPVLTDFFRRDPRHTASWKVGVLYAANTLGAAIGTLAAGFVLIELIGIRYTTLTAAGLNFLVAILGFRFARAAQLKPVDAVSITKTLVNRMGKLTLGVLAASGGIALASEVLWTRALEILIGNSTYAFGMILICYLLGIAAGSWAMSLVVNRLKVLPHWLAALLLGMGIWTFAAIFLFDLLSRSIAEQVSASVTILQLIWIYLQAISILVPLAILSGAMFPVATKILDPGSEDADGVLIARAYAWNTVGALLGSMIGGFVIAALFDYFQSIYILAALYSATAVITAAFILSWTWKTAPKPRPALLLGVLSLALTGLGISYASEGLRFMKRFNRRNFARKVIYHRPGLQGITSVLKRRDQLLADRLLVNGTGMTVKVTDTKMMAHLPLLLHPEPEDTLVICFGMGTTYRSAITYGGRVTVVELVDEVFDAFEFFYKDADLVRAYPKGRMITNDGRNFLKLTDERFDVITIDPPPPIDAAGVNNLYSRDFLELSRDHLKPGGIMAQWVPYPAIKAGVDDQETYHMLLDTFATVYPHSVILESWNRIGVHVLGSVDRPIELSEERLKACLSREAVSRDLMEWNRIPMQYFSRLAPYELSRRDPLLTTDDHPRLEFFLLRSWRSGRNKRLQTVYW